MGKEYRLVKVSLERKNIFYKVFKHLLFLFLDKSVSTTLLVCMCDINKLLN